MNILTPEVKKSVNRSILGNIRRERYDLVLRNVPRVLDLLRVDEYRYKDRTYTRDACQGNQGENHPDET